MEAETYVFITFILKLNTVNNNKLIAGISVFPGISIIWHSHRHARLPK